jgi:hypothetical protein
MAGYIGSKAVNLSTTGADINGDANIDGTLTSDGLTVDANNTNAPQVVFENSHGVTTDAAISMYDDTSGVALALGSNYYLNSAGSEARFNTSEESAGIFIDRTGVITLKTDNSGSAVAKSRLNIAGNGDISFYEDTGTTPKFFWDASAEFLGLGTTSPDTNLHVYHATRNNVALIESGDADVSLYLKDGNSTSVSAVGIGATTDDLTLRAGNAERMRIDSSGMLGLGSTPPTDAHATWSQFFIGEKGSVISEKSGSGGLYGLWLTDNSYVDNDTGSFSYRTTDEASSINLEAGNTVFRYAASGTAGAALTWSESMRIDSSGNVGIGTSSPAWQLHVKGTSNAVVQIEGASSAGSFVNFGDPSDTDVGQIGYDHTSNYMRFKTNDTERMRIDSSGNVGIGTTSPSTYGKLVVDDGKISLVTDIATSRRISFWSTANGNSENAYIQSQNDGGTTNTGEILFATKNAGGTLAERMRITADGDIFIGTGGVAPSSSQSGFAIQDNAGKCLVQQATSDTSANTMNQFINPNGVVGTISVSGSSTSYNTSSDYRLKENVIDITGATDRLKQLEPKRFNFIADPNDTTVDGFLAHEVQSVVPEAITGTHNEVDDDGNPVYQGIDQSKLVPLLVAALQEALNEITDLKARVATLEAN